MNHQHTHDYTNGNYVPGVSNKCFDKDWVVRQSILSGPNEIKPRFISIGLLHSSFRKEWGSDATLAGYVVHCGRLLYDIFHGPRGRIPRNTLSIWKSICSTFGLHGHWSLRAYIIDRRPDGRFWRWIQDKNELMTLFDDFFCSPMPRTNTPGWRCAAVTAD